MRLISPIFLVAAFLLHACCHEACVSESLSFEFEGFEAADIDTVRFTQYYADGKFENPIQTMEFYGYPFSLGADAVLWDWVVTVQATPNSYRVSRIRTGRADCLCESGSYRTIKGFELNGQDISGSQIVISK
jgi:hypothetical protein